MFFVLIFLTISALLSFIDGPYNQKDKKILKETTLETKIISIGQNHFKALLADTPATQIKGLSEIDGLSMDEVMLFIFEQSGRHGIWMKDMKFSIDVLWIDKGHEVVYLKENISPDTFPEIFSSNSAALFVLEAASGFVKKNNIRIGTKIIFLE